MTAPGDQPVNVTYQNGLPSYAQIDTTLGSGSTSTPKPETVWDLGSLYNQPIILGSENTPAPPKIDPTTGRPLTGSVTQKLDYGKTQDIFSALNKMWANQPEERQSDPTGMTQYEQEQQMLWQAGFYGQTTLDKIHLGQWDVATQDALKNALRSYEGIVQSGSPMSFTEFVANNAQQAQNAPGGFYGASNNATGAKATKPLVEANTADLVASVQKAAEDALGHTLSPEQASKFAARFQAEQQQQYQSALNGNTATEAPPSESTQALQYAVQQNPQDFQEEQIQGYTNAFLNLFLPSGTPNRPNTPVDPLAGAVAEQPSPVSNASAQGTANA